MPSPTPALLVLALLLGVSACNDVPPRLRESQVLSLELDNAPEMASMRASLLLAPSSPSGGDATLYAYGAEDTGTYALEGKTLTVTFPADDHVSLPTTATSFCPDVVEAESLTLEVELEAGRIVAANGEASGSISRWLDDDAPSPSPVVWSVTATAEDEAPIDIAQTESLHPLTYVDARVTGETDEETLAFLRHGNPVAWLLHRDDAEIRPVFPNVTRYVRDTSRPLAWGETYTIHGSARADVLGRPLRSTTFTTLSAPASFDTPGFEGEVNALLEGASLVHADDTSFHAPREGTAALLLPPFGRATVVFAAAEAAERTELVARVRFRARYGFGGAPGVSLRFFDHTEVVSVRAEPTAEFATTGIDGPDGTAIATIVVPLPTIADTASFALEIANPYTGNCGGSPLARGEIVIEELRVQ